MKVNMIFVVEWTTWAVDKKPEINSGLTGNRFAMTGPNPLSIKLIRPTGEQTIVSNCLRIWLQFKQRNDQDCYEWSEETKRQFANQVKVSSNNRQSNERQFTNNTVRCCSNVLQYQSFIFTEIV